MTELTVDGKALDATALETLNATGKYDLTDWIFTAYPTVKATMVDNSTPAVSKNENSTVFASRDRAARRFTLNIPAGFHIYTPPPPTRPSLSAIATQA